MLEPKIQIDLKIKLQALLALLKKFQLLNERLRQQLSTQAI